MEIRPYHPDRERRADDNLGSKWFGRFVYLALSNAVIALLWTIPVLIPYLQISMQVAGGSAGTWGFVGYSLFLTVGFASMLGWAFLYYQIPRVFDTKIFSNKLAGLHLVLTETGLLGATSLLSIAGFIGGRLLLAEASGQEIHEALIIYVQPIGYFVIALMVGVMFGVINLGLTIRTRQKELGP